MKAFGGRRTSALPPREPDLPACLVSGAGVVELRKPKDASEVEEDPGESPV